MRSASHDAHPLAVGAVVAVRTVGNKRGVIVEAGRRRYRVRVADVTVWCGADDLKVLPEPRKKKRDSRKPHDVTSGAETAAAGRLRAVGAPASRVDLHGLTVENAIARVVDEIDRALRRGADRIEVVHGKGTGRIRDALHRHLASMPVVAAFALDKSNPGVTWIWF